MFLQKTGENTSKRDNKCLFIYIFLSLQVAYRTWRKYDSLQIIFALEETGPFKTRKALIFLVPVTFLKICFSQRCERVEELEPQQTFKYSQPLTLTGIYSHLWVGST